MLTRRETCTCHCKRREFQRHPRPSDGPPLPRRADNTLQLHRSAITLLAVLEVHSLDVLEHGEHVSTLAPRPRNNALAAAAHARPTRGLHTRASALLSTPLSPAATFPVVRAAGQDSGLACEISMQIAPDADFKLKIAPRVTGGRTGTV